jgi:hypothetical protein
LFILVTPGSKSRDSIFKKSLSKVLPDLIVNASQIHHPVHL